MKVKKKIDKLSPSEKSILDRMIESGATITSIAEHFQENGHDVSRYIVSKYKADWEATEEAIRKVEISAKSMLEKLAGDQDFNVASALVKTVQAQLAEQILDPNFKLDLTGCDPLELMRVLQSASRTENELETVKSKFRKEQEEKDREAAKELEKLEGKGEISKEAANKMREVYGLSPQ